MAETAKQHRAHFVGDEELFGATLLALKAFGFKGAGCRTRQRAQVGTVGSNSFVPPALEDVVVAAHVKAGSAALRNSRRKQRFGFVIP